MGFRLSGKIIYLTDNMTERITENIHLTREERCYRITMSGEADMDFVNAFSRTAQEVERHPENKRLVIDMAGMHYIDSAALSVFIRLIKMYKTESRRVLIFRPQKPILELFQYTNLINLLSICNTEEELEEALAGSETVKPAKKKKAAQKAAKLKRKRAKKKKR